MGRFGRRTIIPLLGGGILSAQDQTFRVDVQLVRMLATVKNAQGQLAGGLTKDDFSVSDNGVPQEISLFERSTTQPLSIGLLVDASRSTEREKRYEVDSVRRFVKAVIREGNPNDAAALYSFNFDVTLQASYTRNLGKIESALGRLKSEGATAMYDAIYLAADDIERRDGRHVVITVSDGGDTISKTKFEQALQMLQRANAVMYSILLVPVKGDAGRNLRGENSLTTLSQWTGGKIFYPTAGESLDATFDEILKELRTQYLIGYYPKEVPPAKNRFHRVELAVKRPGFSVSARNGYFEGR